MVEFGTLVEPVTTVTANGLPGVPVVPAVTVAKAFWEAVAAVASVMLTTVLALSPRTVSHVIVVGAPVWTAKVAACKVPVKIASASTASGIPDKRCRFIRLFTFLL
ncbi:hypothetical protein SBA3_5040002 [Candidatus Sulfopaludibacter sp. SbA3]|nr:hypothetical protein SBA3_5040002 [Candidatus Sulfopaludibacter sp. SbA3]